MPRWVHGDLYARHLLFDGDEQLCGVIDWGDVHRGDPALDLSIAWSFLPRGARAEFRESYCAAGVLAAIDEDTWRRARFTALHYASALMHFGRETGENDLDRVGCTALDYALEA